MNDGFNILTDADKAHDLDHPTWRRGMFFIKTGGVLAEYAGYFFKCAGFRRDIGGVSQVLET
jgi:hypothetical protein